MNTDTDVIVVGGGASGMMAAARAARCGCRVLLLEQMKQPGKKLYATGNGKCNFTNQRQQPECYRGEEPSFIREALQAFPMEKTVRFFRKIGVFPAMREGYYYPASGQAASVVDALTREMQMSGVQVKTQTRVREIVPDSRGFLVKTEHEKYQAQKVILSTGGMASPVHGSRGDGYEMARRLGLKMEEPLPALTACVLKGDFTKEWAKLRTRGRVCLFDRGGTLLAEDTGELQLVSYGISGIPVFQVSRYAARALQENRKPYFLLDIMPEQTMEVLVAELARRRKRFGDYAGEIALEGMLPYALGRVLLKSLEMDPHVPAGMWGSQEVSRIAGRMKRWKVGISQVRGFEFAQVTAGGVRTAQLDPHTMEVRGIPGLYITGELLDVDGICGGYNLQWAWTSGWLAGTGAGSQSLRPAEWRML